MLFVLKESTGTERCTAAEDAAPLSATCPAAAEVAAPLSATCPPPCSPPDAAPPAQVPPRDHQSIQRQILEGQACLLRPMEFFISWGGLPTLAFAGFPTPLLTLKAREPPQPCLQPLGGCGHATDCRHLKRGLAYSAGEAGRAPDRSREPWQQVAQVISGGAEGWQSPDARSTGAPAPHMQAGPSFSSLPCTVHMCPRPCPLPGPFQLLTGVPAP